MYLKSKYLVLFGSLAGVVGALSPKVAFADDLPSGTAPPDPATKGETDVAGTGFETAAKIDAKAKDTTEAQILGGGLLSTGNSRSFAATGSGTFRMRRTDDQFSAVAAANYARAAPAAGSVPAGESTAVVPTVENYQAKVRYDRFLADKFAVFLAVTGRRDRFQKLNLRLNVDPGVAYYVIDDDKHQAWGELGYDFQFDMDNQAAVDAGAKTTDVRHSGRAFLGYRNSLNDAVAFNTGFEYLQGISDTKAWRMNWDVGLTSKIGGNFSLATTFSLKYDHDPLPGVKDTDTTTAASLVYQLL